MKLLVEEREGAGDDDEELVLDAVLGVRAHERVVEADLARGLVVPDGAVAAELGEDELVLVQFLVLGVVDHAGEGGDAGGVRLEVVDEGGELLPVVVHVEEDVQDAVVEGGVELVGVGCDLVGDDAVEEAVRDREDVGHVAARALEVEAAELHALVDVHVGQEFYFRVLGEVEGGVAGAALVVGERKNGVLGTAAGVHVRGTGFVYNEEY